MLKEALQYLVSLKENKTYEINGTAYSDHELHVVEPLVYRRTGMEFGSLDAIVKMTLTELDEIIDLVGAPLFIHVVDHECVEVFTRTDAQEERLFLYKAVCRDTSFKEGWRDQQAAIIELRSRFIPTKDTEYLLDLISRINETSGIQSTDNGVSQTVTVKQGISLAAAEKVRQRISLRPFRTFREVDQPESEFILRLNDRMDIGLFEADGGIWKMEAKDNIHKYFESALEPEIKKGLIVVMV